MARSHYFDGAVLGESDPVAIPLSSALLYGKGIFTTVAINNGEHLLWDKHWERLERSAARLSIDISEHTEESTAKSLHDLISTNNIVNGLARLTLFDLRSTALWPVKSDQNTALAITTAGNRIVPETFGITISPHLVNSTSPLAGIKSCNYLENLKAVEEAKKRGFDEAIRLNERGEVTSGCMASVFWLKNDELYTPSLETGCLMGTTREYVLENLSCREVEARINDLKDADAIFLTSAGLGIVQVVEFCGRELTGKEHAILDLWPPKDAKTRTPSKSHS